MHKSFGKYTVLEKISQGAMAEVFLVEDEKKTKLALKTLKHSTDDETSEVFSRFKREIELCKDFAHENIVKVFDYDLSHTPPFMIMEYAKSGTLEDRLKREKTLEPLEVLKVAVEIASALNYMQSQEIIHRDVKPGNILISEDGTYKLSDLGLAGLSSSARTAGSENLTMSQTALGTPYYIAPEQAINAKAANIQADIYSLGATLYHCLTGERVHEGDSSVHVMMKHVNDEIKNPLLVNDSLPENLSAVIMKMLEKDVKSRYKTPSSLLDDLNKIKEYDAPAEDLIASRMSLNPVRKKNQAGMLMFVCLAGLIFVAGYAFFHMSCAPPSKADKFYQKDRLKVKNIAVANSAVFLTAKATAVERFLVEYPTDPDLARMALAAETARTLTTLKTYHLTVKKIGNLKDARSFAFRLYANENKIYDYETAEQRKFLYPEARMVFNWEPGVKIKMQLEDFDWQNEIMYDAVLADFFSLRGLSGDKVYLASESQKQFFEDGLLHVEYSLDEISEEAWSAFEDFIYPGDKW